MDLSDARGENDAHYSVTCTKSLRNRILQFSIWSAPRVRLFTILLFPAQSLSRPSRLDDKRVLEQQENWKESHCPGEKVARDSLWK